MGLWDFFSKKAANKTAMENQLRAMITQRLNGLTLYPDYTVIDNATRYCTTDDVYSIIKLLSTTAAMIPMYTYIKGKDGGLEDSKEDDPLNLLLEMPFEGMSRFESFYAIYATRYMQGEYIIWKEKPEFGPNAGRVVKLHYLEPQNVNIIISQDFPRRIVGYQYTVDGTVIMDNIPPEEIIHGKYFNPIIGVSGQELRGLSPLKVLAKRLARVDSNNDVTTAQLQNGGVPGIVYEKQLGEGVAEGVGKRKDNFYKYLTSSSNKGAPYFSYGELGYIELGLKLADMEVAELSKIDFKKLCNVFSVSDRLFNNDATGSEVSDKGARIGLYTNATIPDVKAVRDDLNRGLVPEFKGQKYFIDYDISEIPELQDNYKDMVTWLKDAWWLTPNEKREMMKYDQAEDELMDKFILPSGLMVMEDLDLPPMLPNTGDYERPAKP